jgi:hypothetical protein
MRMPLPSILANWILVVALAMNVSWQVDTINPSEMSLGFMLGVIKLSW